MVAKLHAIKAELRLRMHEPVADVGATTTRYLFRKLADVQPPKDYERDPLGYFMFIDDGFRWDSGIVTFKPSEIKHTDAKLVKAKVIKTVAPFYPAEAASNGINGTVRVYFVVGGDGLVYNAHAISGEGLSEDSSLRKAAEEAVLQWRYQPATIDGGPTEAVGVTADIVFSLKN